MKSCLSCVICFQVLLFSAASAADYGRFVGTVKTEWGGDGRHMTLLEPFRYIDTAHHEWLAPADSIVDGASIPQFAWSIIGGPFEGKYRDASVIHDVACQKKSVPGPTFILLSTMQCWRTELNLGRPRLCTQRYITLVLAGNRPTKR